MTHHDDVYDELERAEASVRQEQVRTLQAFQPAYGICDSALRQYAEIMENRVAAHAENVVALTHRTLLPRLADDLRTIWLLASSGYWMQASALSATAIEISATIGFIAFRRDRAQKWLSWGMPDKTPWSARTVVEGAVAHFGGHADTEKVATWMTWYQIFCGMKHANPTIQTRALASLSAAGHAITVLPEVSPRSADRLAITLYSSLQPWYLALDPLLNHDPTPPPNVTTAVEALAAAMRGLVTGGDGLP